MRKARPSVIRLEQLRYDAGLNPRELGEKVGLSHQTIRDIEAGVKPRPATAKALADHFGITATELLMPALPLADEPAEAAA